MVESISLSGVLVALLLPWVMGALWVKLLLVRTGRYNNYVLLGQGYFAGVFATTLILRAWDALGLPLDFAMLSTVLLALALVAFALLRSAQYSPPAPQSTDATASWLVRVGVVFLLALLAWRYVHLFEELLLRPLYSWDAWMNWAPKAIVWFQLGDVFDFVSRRDWLRLGSVTEYTLGNGQSWDYPISVPVIFLWSMLGAGTWDHPMLYLPWLLLPVNLGLALYGHLRLAGISMQLSVVACYLLLSLPYLNVHAVLAGYADLWLAAAFGLGVFALYEWGKYRHWAYGALALFMALFCAQLKVPGIFLGLILMVCVLRAMINLSAKIEALLALLLIGGFLLVLSVGVSFELPYLHEVILSWEEMRVGRVGSFVFKFHHIEDEMLETLYLMANWNLLAYVLVAFGLYGICSGAWWRWPSTEVLAAVTALIFVLSVFFFTGYFTQAKNFVAVNRALLYPVPALLFCCALYFPRPRQVESVASLE